MPRRIERYELCDRIASGGMGSVHLGHLHGSAGFRRIVAIKRMHPELTSDPDFVRAFVEEAKLAGRIRHPNVVPILDALTDLDGELFLILEYVHGEALHRLLRASGAAPIGIVGAIGCGILEGLHAAHTAVDERGAPLEIIHRDVSPQNVMIGADGHARVLDFGVATATRRARGPGLDRRGKQTYMAPEQIVSGEVTPRSDVYSASVILWESLTGQRLFNKAHSLQDILEKPIPKPSSIRSSVPPALDDVVMRGLERNPALRHASAREMSVRLEDAVMLANEREVGEWVQRHAALLLAERAEQIAAIERSMTGVISEEEDGPQFGEFDGVVVTKTRSVPHFEPNAILHYPSDIDPGNRRVAITAHSVVSADAIEPSPFEIGSTEILRRPRIAKKTRIGIAVAAGVLASIALLVALAPGERTELAAAPALVTNAPALLTNAAALGGSPPSEPLDDAPARSRADEPGERAIAEPDAAQAKPIAKKRPARKRAPKPKIDRCDPPFWIDGEGLRRLKPGCD